MDDITTIIAPPTSKITIGKPDAEDGLKDFINVVLLSVQPFEETLPRRYKLQMALYEEESYKQYGDAETIEGKIYLAYLEPRKSGHIVRDGMMAFPFHNGNYFSIMPKRMAKEEAGWYAHDTFKRKSGANGLIFPSVSSKPFLHARIEKSRFDSLWKKLESPRLYGDPGNSITDDMDYKEFKRDAKSKGKEDSEIIEEWINNRGREKLKNSVIKLLKQREEFYHALLGLFKEPDFSQYKPLDEELASHFFNEYITFKGRVFIHPIELVGNLENMLKNLEAGKAGFAN